MGKNRVLRFLSAFTAIVLLVMLAAPLTHADHIDRYGYSLLQNENQRIAYEAIAVGIGALDTQINIAISGVTSDAQFNDIAVAAKMVHKDYPEYFWYHGNYSLTSNGQQVTFLPAAYTINGQTVTAGSDILATAQAKVDAAVNEALSGITGTSSDYEISLAVHDYIVANVVYQQGGDDQTAYGALVAGQAVCAGYTKAYQLIMNAAGISCWYVEGDSYDPTGNLVPHAWNLVWLDGKCYYSDATWDDQGTELFHEYMNMSLENISRAHFTSDPLPKACGHDDYTYFRNNNTIGVCDIRETKTAEEVALCFKLKKQTGTKADYYCTIHYHGDDFQDWLDKNIAAIAQILGYSGSFSYSSIELNHEHHVTLTGDISQTVTTPTEPSVEPTTAPTTAPSTVPTTLPPTTQTQPTKPSTQATEQTASTQSTEPTAPTQATEPTEPTQATEPTEPAIQPTTEPSTVSTEMQTQPSTQPSQSPTETTVPMPQHSESTEPSQSETAGSSIGTLTTEQQATPESTGKNVTPTVSLPSTSNITGSDFSSSGDDNGGFNTESENNMTRFIIIFCVILVGVGVTIVILILKKRKKE